MSRYFTYYIFSLVGILHDIYFTWRIVYFMRSFTRHIFSLIDILHNIYFLTVFIYFTWHIQYFTNGIGRCERFSKLLSDKNLAMKFSSGGVWLVPGCSTVRVFEFVTWNTVYTVFLYRSDARKHYTLLISSLCSQM